MMPKIWSQLTYNYDDQNFVVNNTQLEGQNLVANNGHLQWPKFGRK